MHALRIRTDITEPSDCFPCRIGDPSCTADCPGLDDAITGQQDCLDCLAGGCSDNGNSFFNMCTAQCASPKPGVCALNLTCVRGCRIQAGGKQQQCRNRFRQQVRGTCALVACGADPNYFRTAKQVRNQCDKACKKGLDAATPAVATLPGTALQSTRGCNCQQQCIRTIVGGCFNQCVVACRGDNDALRLCNNACRNAQCASLRQNCASDSANPSISYSACCEQCSAVGGCDNDLDAETLCTPTTSTTTTTNTTLSTTTTTIAGQTTTSSTSTTTLF